MPSPASTEIVAPAVVAAPNVHRAWFSRFWLWLVLAILCVPFVFPSVWMLLSSFKTVNELFAYPPSFIPKQWTFEAYVQAFTAQPYLLQIWNSFYIATVVTAGTMVISSLAGYAFARIRFRGANIVFVIVLAALFVPIEATLVPMFRVFQSVGMINTHWPMILLPIFGAPSVLATFIMRQFFVTLPVELEESARLDGLSTWGIFWRIAMPLARPALGAVAIFSFLGSWNSYLEALVFLQEESLFTFPVALTHFVDFYTGPLWNVQLAASTVITVPVLIIFVLAQKQFIEGLAHTGLK